MDSETLLEVYNNLAKLRGLLMYRLVMEELPLTSEEEQWLKSSEELLTKLRKEIVGGPKAIRTGT
jgi:hypothetical protein